MPNFPKSYQLWRTTCSTDWKGIPAHSLQMLATSDVISFLIGVMNKDVNKWQATDVAASEFNDRCEANDEPPAGWDIKRAEELAEDPSLPGKWKALKNGQYEVVGRPAHIREFCVHNDEGNVCTIVYHLVEH